MQFPLLCFLFICLFKQEVFSQNNENSLVYMTKTVITTFACRLQVVKIISRRHFIGQKYILDFKRYCCLCKFLGHLWIWNNKYS